jgi:hypothetical protein
MNQNLTISDSGKSTWFLAGEQGPCDLVFTVEAGEMLRIKGDGTFLVQGRVVANDIEIYEAMKHWLEESNAMPPRPVFVGQ